MKVLLFSTQWPEYTIELANALVKKHQTVLMIPENHRMTKQHVALIEPGVLFEPYRVVLFTSFRKNLLMLMRILRVLWRHRPDVFHIQANGHPLLFYILFFKPLKTKIVNTIHDPVKHTGDKVSHAIDDSRAVRWGRFFTTRYIVHGKIMREVLSQAYKIHPDRVDVVPHGHFGIYKKFRSTQYDEDPFQVLFFGRIWAYKGLANFIEAGNILAQKFPTVKCVIVGAGEAIDPYLSKIRFWNNFVVVNERVSLETADGFFQRSAIVVLPYIEATQSGVIPVAYAYGKPVVASRVGSIPEAVIHGVTGFLVDPASVNDLAEKILLLLRDQELRKTMGQNAFAFAHRELSWDLIASRTTETYMKATTS